MSAARNPVQRLFDWKVRGVRWVEIIGVACVAAMVFSVYVAKAGAARESARIGEMERQIDEDRQRVRLLRAEVSRLEQPGRLEALSRGAGLAPVAAKQQADAGTLATLRPIDQPAPLVVAAAPRPSADAVVDDAPTPPGAEPAAATVPPPVVEAQR